MCWECSCLRQWKQPFILDQITWRIWRSTRTRTSRKFRACSMSHRSWYWSIRRIFWMWIRLTVHLFHGRDQYCPTIKWSSGQKRKCVSTQIPFYLWEGWMTAKMRLQDEKVKWNIFPGFSSLQILQEIQNDSRRRNIEPEKFTDRIIFVSVFNDIDWTRKGNDGICISNSEKVMKYSKRFSQGHWTF